MNEISIQEVTFYRVIRASTAWMTARELAGAAGIAERTARAYSRKFVTLGLAARADVFPAHRYRWSHEAFVRGGAYLKRLEQADTVFADGRLLREVG